MLCGHPCDGDTQTHGLKRLISTDERDHYLAEDRSKKIVTVPEEVGSTIGQRATSVYDVTISTSWPSISLVNA